MWSQRCDQMDMRGVPWRSAGGGRRGSCELGDYSSKSFPTPGLPQHRRRLNSLVSSPLRGNASFSRLPHHTPTSPRLTHAVSAPRLNAMPGDGLHSFSFSPGVCRGSFQGWGGAGRWLYRSYLPGRGQGGTRTRTGGSQALPTTLANPNRAVLIIDDQARILTANDVCSALMGRPEEELCGGQTRLTDFLHLPSLRFSHHAHPLSTSPDGLLRSSLFSTESHQSPSFSASVSNLLHSLSLIPAASGQNSSSVSTSVGDLQSPLANGISQSPSLNADGLLVSSPHARNTDGSHITSENPDHHSTNVKDLTQSFTPAQTSNTATNIWDSGEKDSVSQSLDDGCDKPENHKELVQASQDIKEFLSSCDEANKSAATPQCPDASTHTDLPQAKKLSTPQNLDPSSLSPHAPQTPSLFPSTPSITPCKPSLTHHAPTLASHTPSIMDSSPLTASESSTLSDATHDYDMMKKDGLVICSGKVVSVHSVSGGQQFCSLWLKALPREEEPEDGKKQEREKKEGEQEEKEWGEKMEDKKDGQRWVAVLEPVNLLTARASLDWCGNILSHDAAFPSLFGQPCGGSVEGASVLQFIPALTLPTQPSHITEEEFAWQHCTGRAVDHTTFPLQAVFSLAEDEDGIDVDIWVVRDLSGLVVVDDGCSVVDYNRSFTRLMFGYSHNQLIGKSITELIPDIYEEVYAQQREGEVGVGEGESGSLVFTQDTDDTQKENTGCVIPGLTRNPTFSLTDSLSTVSTPNTAFIFPDSKLQGSLFTSGVGWSSSTGGEDSQAMRDITNSVNVINLSHQNTSGVGVNMSNSCSTTASPKKPHTASDTVTKGATGVDMTLSIVTAREADLITSTPAPDRSDRPGKDRMGQLEDGDYCGFGRHKDGADLAILYHIRRVEVSGVPHYCLWITRHDLHPDDEPEEGVEEKVEVMGDGNERVEGLGLCVRRPDCLSTLPPPLGLSTTQPSPLTESTDVSLGHVIRSQAQQANNDRSEDADDEDTDIERTDDEATDNRPVDNNEMDSKQVQKKKVDNDDEDGDSDEDSRHTSTNGSSGAEYSLIQSRKGNLDDTTSSCVDEELERQTAGEFSRKYTVLRQIGKGAFGCVRMSVRNSDGLLVVTKFIKKGKVYKDSWVDDMLLRRRVPLEVSLLMTLSHPNIVSVHEMFESEDYFQLVMEKWGSGMDLFEFIDRNPVLDEPLAAHIFRQIVSALRYLHSLNIVHRDVKDENVILDSNFHVKLIDFGSAAFTRPGRTFAQFAGTVEYCSPEVLKGNRYSGYELEVWSLGVTMYTLMYGENPFYDIDQTISALLTFPFHYSTELTSLLSGMLEKDVMRRLTMEEVAQHPWTQTPCVIEDYPFHEVVRCTYEECHPPTHAAVCPPTIATDTSLSTTSDSFVYHAASPAAAARAASHARRSLSFSPQRQHSINDNEVARFQRSATSLSISRLNADLEEREEEGEEELEEGICLFPVSSGASRTSTSQSVSSLKSTITVDSSSFSCCSPSTHSNSSTHPGSSPLSSTHHTTTSSISTSQLESSTHLDSSVHLDSSSTHLDSSSGHLDSSTQLDLSSTHLDSSSHVDSNSTCLDSSMQLDSSTTQLDSSTTQLDSFTNIDVGQLDSMLSGQV